MGSLTLPMKALRIAEIIDMSGLLILVSGPLIAVSSLLIPVSGLLTTWDRKITYIDAILTFLLPLLPLLPSNQLPSLWEGLGVGRQFGWQKGQKGHFFFLFPHLYTRAHAIIAI